MSLSPRDKYNNAFYEAFDLDKNTDLSELKYQSIDEWDSIGHMTLMSELEDNFDVNHVIAKKRNKGNKLEEK